METPAPFIEVFIVGACPVGLQQGQWVTLDGQEGIVPLEAARTPGLVVLLEGDPAGFRTELGILLQALGLEAHLAGTFPLVSILRTGLEWPAGGGSWLGLALTWVEELELAAQVMESLAVAARSARRQMHRHQARRLLRRAQASRPIGSAEEFIRLRNSEDREEYQRAAHGAASPEVWDEVIARFPDMRRWVAQNKTIPSAVMERLALDPDPQVRSVIASGRACPEAVMQHLVTDSEEGVRARLAKNPKLPVHLLIQLANDPSPLVIKVAKARLRQP